MKLPRRTFLHLAAGAAAWPAVPRAARAQAYPSRPVRIIVGFPAGGAQDVPARLMGDWMSARLGQPVAIDNQPGAGTNTATETVVRAAADGYTLLLAVTANAVNTTLYDKLPFSFARDIAPVASISRVPLVVVVHPSFPAKTFPQFLAYAIANSGKISMGTTGVGGTPHLAGEMFKMMTGIKMVNTPFRGADGAQAGLVEGRAQVMFSILPEAIENIRTEKLRVLAATTAKRIDILPHLPLVQDFVSGYEASTWNGIAVPAATPPAVIDQLNNTINAGLADPAIRLRFAQMGSVVLPGSATNFGRMIASETEKWGRVVKFAGLKPPA